MRTQPVITVVICLMLLAILPACEKHPEVFPFDRFIWEVSTPLNEGMDPLMVDSAFLLASGYGFVDGLLIVRNGKIVAEDYYNGFAAELPHNLMSVSKSMLSAITGLVLNGPYGLDLEDRMLDYFPQYNSASLDPRKQDITIEHLLTMRMGIAGEAEDKQLGELDQEHHRIPFDKRSRRADALQYLHHPPVVRSDHRSHRPGDR